MSVTPLALDVGASSPQGKLVEKVARVARQDENGEKLGLQKSVAPQAVGETKKTQEAHKSKAEKTPVVLLDSGLEFSLDSETGLTIIKVYDRANGKMVRQVPTEETLDFLRKLVEQEEKKGILVSRKL